MAVIEHIEYMFQVICMSSVLGEEKKSVKKLQIGIKKRVENCSVKSRKGDKLSMHYTVSSFYPLTLLFSMTCTVKLGYRDVGILI